MGSESDTMKKKYPKPEVWAGIECTINRLDSGYIDQLEMSGHYNRPEDLDAIAALGISTLRYPVLWEKHQPEKDGKIDFSWASDRLNQIKKLNVKPIVGLVHHGSGPEFTNLLDPQFPYLFADYARKVATEFPWVEMYTPINEPLTTARFSGLYGLWFPHETNDVSFVTMLLNQLKGVVLSMAEIRKINPNAKLVQTEDLGKTYSTKLLKYQADWENRRRWLTWDILCGKVDESHKLWNHFKRLGIPENILLFFIENPCPPDIIGVNHYVTSERYLDQNMRKYPKHARGGNTIHNYADVEAIRVRLKTPSGFKVLMKELWKRYNIPIAVTEAHLHCSREEQMKWFLEIYRASVELAQNGMDIRAVTAWSVLGAYGWNKLLTVPNGEYERGAFDVSSGVRRPTAMASMIREIAETGKSVNPLVQSPGWWNRESRFYGSKTAIWDDKFQACGQPILIVGKTGTLGRAISRICKIRSLHHVIVGRDQMDICNEISIRSAIQEYQPWAIINAAGFVRVDEAENDRERCFAENAIGPENLAKICADLGIRLMTFSSDLVFDGKKELPYVESDQTNPLNVYGDSKAKGEQAVLGSYPNSLVIRTSAFFSPWDKYNFAHAVIATLTEGREFCATCDLISPTYIPHLVNASLDLLLDSEAGIWHLANIGAVRWIDFARVVAEKTGLDTSLIKEINPILPAKRPTNSVLASEKGVLMPTLDCAVDAYVNEIRISARKFALVR